jgi:hypothetical protein
MTAKSPSLSHDLAYRKRHANAPAILGYPRLDVNFKFRGGILRISRVFDVSNSD